MLKTYLVAGASWVAEIDLENTDNTSEDNLKIEAASRAVEAHIGRRPDILVDRHSPISLTKDEKELSENELHAALVELLTTEIDIGCGIGALLCIMDSTNEQNESFISSKIILENVGIPRLIQKFNEKYP